MINASLNLTTVAPTSNEMLAQDAQMHLELLFTEDDKIFMTDMRPSGQFRTHVSKLDKCINRPLICISPVMGTRNKQDEINLKGIRNFVFETDKMPLHEQYAVLEKIKSSDFPIRSVVWSGNKSLHFVISCGDDLVLGNTEELVKKNYVRIWKGLESQLAEFGLTDIDQTLCRINALTRLAGQIRASTANIQTLVYKGHLTTSSFLHSIIKPETSERKIIRFEHIITDINNMSDFEAVLSRPENLKLLSFMRTPAWVKSENNYERIFNIGCWIVDATGCPFEVANEYFEKHVGPWLQHAGYKSQFNLGLINAYKYKNRL